MAERTVTGGPVDNEFVLPLYILKHFPIGETPDGGLVELHLDPADAGEIIGIDQPFRPLTIAFQEGAPSGETDDIPKRVCRHPGRAAIPIDRGKLPGAEGSPDYLYGYPVQSDIVE